MDSDDDLSLSFGASAAHRARQTASSSGPSGVSGLAGGRAVEITTTSVTSSSTILGSSSVLDSVAKRPAMGFGTGAVPSTLRRSGAVRETTSRPVSTTVGRHTGMLMPTNVKRDAHGFENIDDFFGTVPQQTAPSFLHPPPVTASAQLSSTMGKGAAAPPSHPPEPSFDAEFIFRKAPTSTKESAAASPAKRTARKSAGRAALASAPADVSMEITDRETIDMDTGTTTTSTSSGATKGKKNTKETAKPTTASRTGDSSTVTSAPSKQKTPKRQPVAKESPVSAKKPMNAKQASPAKKAAASKRRRGSISSEDSEGHDDGPYAGYGETGDDVGYPVVESADEEEEAEEARRPAKKSKTKVQEEVRRFKMPSAASPKKVAQRPDAKKAKAPTQAAAPGKKVSSKATTSASHGAIESSAASAPVIIPVEKVKLPEVPKEADDVRRSSRPRIAPLAYWKGEAPVYNRRESGWQLAYVQKFNNDEATAQSSGKGRSRRTKSDGGSASTTIVSSARRYVQLPDPQGLPEDGSLVVSVGSRAAVPLQIVAAPSMVLEDTKDVAKGVTSSTAFETRAFECGILHLEKGSTYVLPGASESAWTLFVRSGRVRMQLNHDADSVFEIMEGCFVSLPPTVVCTLESTAQSSEFVFYNLKQ